MRMFSGDGALAAGRFKDAVAHYEAVIAWEPAHAAALNNLAWALGEMHDARALQYAQQALRLSPRNPDVLNTFGVLQLNFGDPAQGLESLSAARALAPHRADLRLHHAKGLLKTHHMQEARAELMALAAEPADSEGRAEAVALLKTLPAAQ
jgi:tetratricopeptide (TPR) repeat protein